MKLIVGLGNPGNQYNFTRHNFGFLALDFYAKIHEVAWEKSPKYDTIYARVRVPGEDFLLIKPQTFYNEVGTSVQKFARFYRVKPEDILVLSDDFNIPFGTLRYRESGSAGGNNGLKSLISNLGTEGFPRLRLGTGNDLRGRMGDTDFVLGKFTNAEMEKMPDLLRTIAERINELS